MGYILITCIERELSVAVCDNLERAKTAMKQAYETALGEQLKEKELNGEAQCSEDELLAWINDLRHNNYDWKIVELKGHN